MSQKAKTTKTASANKAPKIMRVSGRDQEIYQQTEIEGQAQRTVALEKKISQARVSKIVKRVNLWLSQTVPYGFAELPREQRLNMGARLHRMKLDWMYDQATAAWQESKQPLRTMKEKIIKGESVKENIVKTQVGNFRLLDGACKLAERKLVFDGFALDGKVEVSCDGRLFEPPAQSEDELMTTLRADLDQMLPILEDWERKEQEEEQENNFATSLATCSNEEPTERLSEISVDHVQEDVTAVAVSANDNCETSAEVLSEVTAGPVSPCQMEHVASDVAKAGTSGKSAKVNEGTTHPQLRYQTPPPRYHEAEGYRRPIPHLRMTEDPNPKKLPGMWLKHPAYYAYGEEFGGEWVPGG